MGTEEHCTAVRERKRERERERERESKKVDRYKNISLPDHDNISRPNSSFN